jgi:hypothetical protein
MCMLRRQGGAYYACARNMPISQFLSKTSSYNPQKKKMGVKAGSRARTSVPKKKIRGEGLACQRACCAGESCFRTHFRNGSHGVLHLKSSHYIGFTVHVLRH